MGINEVNMDELNKLTASFVDTLKNSDLQEVTVDLVETMTDSLLKEGLIRDIPIINILLGIGKTTVQIKDYLFLKKIIYFISELSAIPSVKRSEMITKIDSSKEYRIKVGEKLLYIIEKCADHEKSQIIARLFKSFINGIISYSEFLRASSIVERILSEDLQWFVQNDFEELELEKVGDLVNSGLFEISPISITVEDQWDHKQSNKYIVEGDKINVTITTIGKIIREELRK